MSIYEMSAMERRRQAQERAQMQAAVKVQENKAAEEEDEKGFWATLGDIGANILKGAMKSIEGIYDLGASVVGGVGGWFSDDFEEAVRSHVEYDVTEQLTPWVDELEKYSYLGEDSFIRSVAQGVGGMLPAVATGGLSHIGAVGTATMMAGAAGQGTEEAMKSGAGYGSALAYGVTSGAVEGLTEKIGGYTFGGGTSKVGKAIAGTKFGEAVSKGVGKVAFDAVSEGAEEVLADYIDPALKYVTGVDKNIGENYLEAAKNTGETFLTGAAVGSAMQGGQTLVRSGVNKLKGRGGAKATRADNAMQNILEVTKNYTGASNTDIKYDNAVKNSLKQISDELVKMTPEQRGKYLEGIGVYKSAFDSETGALKENAMPYAHREAVSANLRTFSGNLSHKPLMGTESITNGAKTAKKTVERVVGSGASVVVTNELSAEDRAIYNPDDGVIYINNNAELTGEDVAKAVALHEVTHLTEGTKAYTKLVEQIKAIMQDKNAPESVKKILGDVNLRTVSTAIGYEKDMESMSGKQAAYLVETEVNADLIGDLLSDDYFIERLAERDMGLLEKLYHSFKNRANAKKSELGPDGIKYLKKLASKFGAAIEKRASGVKLSQIGDEDEEKKEKPQEAVVSNERAAKDNGKKITIGMSDTERTEILNGKKIVAPIYEGEADELVIANLNKLKSLQDGSVKDALVAIGEDLESFDKAYNVEDADVQIVVSRGTLKESAKKTPNPEQIAKLLPKIKVAIESAVHIESHRNRYYYDDTTVRFDNLFGGYIEGDSFVPIRFGLKYGNDKKTTLYVVIDQTKIKTEVIKAAEMENPSPTTSHSVTYSISQIVPFVNNKDILRYFPDDMLNEQQKALKWEGIAETIEYTDKKNDKKYFEFIKAGNLQAARQMVKQAARTNGYTIEGFHGTRYTFNEFSAEERGKNTQTKTSNKMFFAADEATAKSYHPYSVIEALQGKEAAEKLKNKGNLYHLFIKMENPLIVDVADYDYVAHRENADAWMEFVEQAEKDGNDGIILLNGLDNQLRTSARESTVYMFRESSQAKLAETITYDENDNVVPISKRFDKDNPDIRYSRKRAYDPKNSQDITFEAVEGGVKVNFNDFEPHKSNDNSNDFEAAERARRENLDALLKNGEPPRYRPVSADKDTELLRRVVNNTKAKKYTRADVKAIVTELLSSEGYFGDNTVVMKGKKRAELEKMLWQALNTKGKGELGGAALDAAEYIIQNAIAVEYLEVTDDIQLAVQFVDALKPYLHNMNLDFIKGDIKAKFDKDKTPYLMWAAKKDSSFRGYTADEVAQELEALGFRIDKTSEADIFLEINELYRLAKQTITDAVPARDTLLNALGTEKAKKLKQALAKDILNAQEEKGTETSFYKLQQKYIKQINELGEKVKTAHKRNTLENRILKEAKKIYDSNKHTFANATEVQTEALKNIKKLLSRVNSREQVNRSCLRAIMKELAIWYSEKNPVLEGFYDNYIAEHLAYFAESEVEETISEREDNGQSRTPVPTPEKTENAKREKPLSMGELEMVRVILHHMNHVFENFGKMWRGGKYVEASDVASAQHKKLKEAEANHSSFEKAILHNKALRYIMDPMAVLAAWDGHDPDGYFTTTYREFAEGLIGQRWDEMQALSEFDKFRKSHNKYFKMLTNGNDKIKVSGRIDPRNLTISEIEIPKNVAIDLYMVSKTGQAIVTLEEVGYKVRIDGQHEQETMQTITKGQIEEMYNKFSEEDKELISIMERAYNGYCRDLKYNTDMKRLGFSNVFEGYYYPINRISATDFDTDDFFQMMERVSNISANKSRVKGAKNAIIASNALTKFMRHVNAVARYANLAIPVENMNRVFNLDISGDKHMPTSIKTKLSENALWKGAEDYMKRLTDDVQQIGVKPDGGSKTISWLRGNYAKFQLGANPKVWFTQISSYFASFGELRASSLAKAAAIDGSDVDKYCRLAAIRHYDKAATKAQSITDKAGNVLTAPIESVDRGVIRKLFAACQAEAQARYKFEIGTEENKIKAGEILTEVILKTQQNQLITEQSAAMRSTSEIIKSFTMFSADSMKLLSRFVQYMGEVATLKNRIKAAREKGDSSVVEQLTAQRNRAVKSLLKSSASILAVSVWMAALAKLFKLLYNKDDEEETVAEWLGEGTLSNIIGMVPFVRDAYSYFADGYDTDIFVTSMANDVLKSVSKTRDIFTAWVSGKEVTSGEFYSNIRSLAYSFGQIFGLPTRNVYNFTTGIIRRIDEGTGKSIDAWFKAPSESDAKASIREGIEDRDGSLTEYGLNQVYKKYEIEASDKALKSEFDRLLKLNATKDEDDNTDYGPLSSKIPENLEIDGEDVELSAEDRKVFKNGLKSAEKSSAAMVKTYYYKKLSDKYRAYALRKVFEYFDLLSRETVGAVSEERARLLYYGDAVGIDMLAVLLAYKQELNGASDEEKAKRTKSTKELITEYLNKFNLTPVQKSLVLRALGYSDKDNDKLVKSFIERRPGLSKEQRAEFLEIAKIA